MKIFSLTIIVLLFSVQLFAQRDESTNGPGDEITFDIIDFESPRSYLSIDTSSGNLWEICKPNKTFFDSAFSADSAIITSFSDYYPDNNHSWFDLYIGRFNIPWYPESMYFEMKHKYDTEKNHDGGYITVSYDLGKTWMNIINDSVYYAVSPSTAPSDNLYSEEDTLFNGEFGFSGYSKDWITTAFSWFVQVCMIEKAEVGDTMIIRFNFISDSSSSNHEGWMIDDIRLYIVEPWGINDINNSKLIQVYPNPGSTDLHVELDRAYQSIDVEVLDMAGKTVERYHFSGINCFTLDCSSLKNGLYILKTSLNTKTIEYKKIIVRR